MRRNIIFSMTVLAAGCLFGKDSGKVSKDLKGVDPQSTVNVIVQFVHRPDEPHFKKVTKKGGVMNATLDLVNGGAFTIPASSLDSLEKDPQISYISLDRPVKPTLEYANPTVGADVAMHYGWTGKGVGVAVIDSGVMTTPDLRDSKGKPRIVYSNSFVPGQHGTDDHYGHGTHVAGIIGGNAAQSTGTRFTKTFRGIAPEANIINLRALDENGASSDSMVIAAIQEAIRLKDQYNIRVLNLSLGRAVFESYTTDPLCQAVEAAWKAGIVVVAAAGNGGRDNSAGTNGYGTITSPANDPYVITVGAMKDMGTVGRGDDLIASYSSKGPTAIDHIVKPDLVAPGNRIVSTDVHDGTLVKNATAPIVVALNYYVQTNTTGKSPAYFRLSGTSMAAPMVSGAAALMIQKEPGLTPDIVKARLMKTSTKTFPGFSVAVDPQTGMSYTSQYDIFTVGAGYLDIPAALSNTDVFEGTALSPTAVYDAASGVVALVDTIQADRTSAAWGSTTRKSAAWGSSTSWGTRTVWGSSVLVDDWSVALSGLASWGSSASSGFDAIWSKSAISASTPGTDLSGTSVVAGEN